MYIPLILNDIDEDISAVVQVVVIVMFFSP